MNHTYLKPPKKITIWIIDFLTKRQVPLLKKTIHFYILKILLNSEPWPFLSGYHPKPLLKYDSKTRNMEVAYKGQLECERKEIDDTKLFYNRLL